MRVAFFTDTFLPTTNGVVSSVVNFARGLSELGHEVVMFAPDHPGLRERKPTFSGGVRVEWLKSVKGRFYQDLRVGLPSIRVYQKLKGFDPDVVHVFTPLTIGLMGVVLAKRLNKPLVFTHGTRFDDVEMLKAVKLFDVPFMKVVQKRGAGGIIRRVLNVMDTVLVASKDTLSKVRQLKVSTRLELVPIPVPVRELRESKKRGLKMREELGIRKALIYVGRLSGEKGVGTLIRAFAKLAQDFSELRLVLIGDGPDRKRLFDLSCELGVNQRVVWVGELSYSRLIEEGWFYLGDVLVVLGEVETQGLSTVEAMACGLVVVGSSKGATFEVIGDAGVVVDSKSERQVASRVAKLLRDKGLMARMKKRGLTRAEQFSIEKCSSKLVEVYRGLIRGGDV